MRRINRQLKVTINIPDSYDNIEDFMRDLMDRMDDDGGDAWAISLGEGKDSAMISNIKLADIDIGPEDDDEE